MEIKLNLSDKRIIINSLPEMANYKEEDVKEFIKLLNVFLTPKQKEWVKKLAGVPLGEQEMS